MVFSYQGGSRKVSPSFFRHTSIAAAVFVAAALLACVSGLTPTQQAQLDAFNSLKSIRVLVVAGVEVFNKGYQSGQFNEAQRLELGILYNKYLTADTIAATALQTTTTSDPGKIVSNVFILASDILRFIQSLKVP